MPWYKAIDWLRSDEGRAWSFAHHKLEQSGLATVKKTVYLEDNISLSLDVHDEFLWLAIREDDDD